MSGADIIFYATQQCLMSEQARAGSLFPDGRKELQSFPAKTERVYSAAQSRTGHYPPPGSLGRGDNVSSFISKFRKSWGRVVGK